MKHAGGRPSKEPEKKARTVSISLTPEAHQILSKYANMSGRVSMLIEASEKNVDVVTLREVYAYRNAFLAVGKSLQEAENLTLVVPIYAFAKDDFNRTRAIKKKFEAEYKHEENGSYQKSQEGTN